MADPRSALTRITVTLTALAMTLGGWLMMAMHDHVSARAAPREPTTLPPIPELDMANPSPLSHPAPPRPTPIATTRSSR